MGPNSTRKPCPGPAREHKLLPDPARPPRSSEPILIPKLPIRFAAFPSLHCYIDQRLLTSETCCGYGYDPVRRSRVPLLDFQGPAKHPRRHNNCGVSRRVDENHFVSITNVYHRPAPVLSHHTETQALLSLDGEPAENGSKVHTVLCADKTHPQSELWYNALRL